MRARAIVRTTPRTNSQPTVFDVRMAICLLDNRDVFPFHAMVLGMTQSRDN